MLNSYKQEQLKKDKKVQVLLHITNASKELVHKLMEQEMSHQQELELLGDAFDRVIMQGDN